MKVILKTNSKIIEPINVVKKRQYYPKSWWYYKQKRQQKKLEQQTLPLLQLKPKKNLLQSAPIKQSLNLPKQPNFPLNAPKKDILLYRDDADINVTDVKDHIALRCNDWKQINFDKRLLANMKNCGFIWPRKVQEAVIPYIIEGFSKEN
uniref:Uncharacterized protein n=1 Tax=Panagrolaimus sp. PS1159 TaxID=55785 RepID=A0AC35GS60_9BILA